MCPSRLEALEVLAPSLLLTGTRPDGWDDANARFLEVTGVRADDPVDRQWTRVLRAAAAARAQSLVLATPPDGRPSRGLRVSVLHRNGARRRCVLRFCRMPSAPDRWYATVTDIHREDWGARRIARLREALREARAARDALVRKVVAAQEEERARITAELHDHLGQNLAALRWALADRSGPLVADANRALEALVHDTDRQIERLMPTLRPYASGPGGLRENLAIALAAWSARHGVQAALAVRDGFPERLPRHMASTLFRIVLAALHNVGRHAQATRVSVVLGQDPGVLRVTVEDDGRGFDTSAALPPAGPRQRAGSAAMEQRAAMLGGTCEWDSVPGGGTRVLVRIPRAPSRHRTAQGAECG
jgi:signal transduction histidine kinase